MSRQPFFPLFFGDLLAATSRWNGEQRALYVMLLAYQWFNGPLPADEAELALMAQYPPERFAQLWPRVRGKFVETEDGLINERCEEHRAKAQTISERRARAGSLGGQSTQAKAREELQQPPQQPSSKDQANASSLLPRLISHQIYPIPSDPIPSQSKHTDEERARENSQSTIELTDAEHHERFGRCKEAYPPFAGRQDWIYAEHAARKLVSDGTATWEQLLEGVRRYAAYVAGGGVSSSKYVLTPMKFFSLADQPWRQDWNLPEPTDGDADRDERARREFLKGKGS